MIVGFGIQSESGESEFECECQCEREGEKGRERERERERRRECERMSQRETVRGRKEMKGESVKWRSVLWQPSANASTLVSL